MNKELFKQKSREWSLIQKKAREIRSDNPSLNLFDSQKQAYHQLKEDGTIN